MILIDTDVIIDFALDRRPHSDSASELLERIERGAEQACIAWHTISNLYYIVMPTHGPNTIRGFIMELTNFVSVAPTDTESIRYALELSMSDFDYAMQVAAARSCGATRIVTQNIKDYQHSPIRAVTPGEALETLR